MTAHQTELSHPNHRPDIDGLRSVSVVAVVAFHAFPSWVSGGFTGVDVFFVISGYLISTIIFDNLDKGSFSFSEFYARRVNRIFPALILVLVACFVFGYFSLLTDEYKQLGKHIAAGAGFISNFILWSESGYFDNTAETKPLLHLWSLGIEEQFYIAWPLLLWFVLKRKFSLFKITFFFAIAAFTLNLKGVKEDVVATFYSPLTRFWELLSGSLLAWITLYKKEAFDNFSRRTNAWLSHIPCNNRKENNNLALANVLSFVGLFLLLYGFFRINKELSFPGKWALIPVLGGVLIITAGSRTWVNRTILSNRIAVWFGLISFPLYLWHWPLLSFARILESNTPSREIRIAAVLASIALAWLTYRFIETPIRLHRNRKRIATYLFVLMIAVGYVGYNTFIRDGYSFRYSQSFKDNLNRGWAWWISQGATVEGTCSSLNKISGISRFCWGPKEPRLILIGDSHAGHLSYGFAHSKNKIFNKVSVRGAGACPPTLGVERWRGCNQALIETINYIKETPSIEYVVLSAYKGFIDSTNSDSSDMFFEGFGNTISLFRNLHKKIIFVIDNPTFKVSSSPELCEPRPLKLRAALYNRPQFCDGPSEDNLVENAAYDKLVLRLRLDNPDVYFYDPTKLFCSNGRCDIFYGSRLLYGDWSHLSIYGSQYMVDDLIRNLELLKY